MSRKKLSTRHELLLRDAVIHGDSEALRNLIKKHATSVKNYFKNETLHLNRTTLLHLAIQGKRIWIAEVLIQNKAGVNNVNADGITPLHCAAEANSTNAIKLLMDHGADINKTDIYQLSALHYAAGNGCEAAVKKLLEYDVFYNRK